MNPFSELFKKSYAGFYRAKIIEVDNTVKNGRYKIRVWPYLAKAEEDKLPWALSNMTNINQHISLKVGQFVFIFNENSNPRFPIIFDLCNVKDSYPDVAKGTQPNWWSNMQAETSINESTVNYNGEYNKIDAFDFGEIHVEFDEQNKQFVLMINGKYFIIDSNGSIHQKAENEYINVTQNFNVASQAFKFKTTSGNEISISSSGQVKINGGPVPLDIKNELVSLKQLIEDCLIGLSTGVFMGNLGLPVVFNNNPKLVSGLIKLNQLLS